MSCVDFLPFTTNKRSGKEHNSTRINTSLLHQRTGNCFKNQIKKEMLLRPSGKDFYLGIINRGLTVLAQPAKISQSFRISYFFVGKKRRAM